MSTQDEEKLLDAGDLNHRIVAILVANKVKISAGTTLIHDITSLIKSQSESIKEQAERDVESIADTIIDQAININLKLSEDIIVGLHHRLLTDTTQANKQLLHLKSVLHSTNNSLEEK